MANFKNKINQTEAFQVYYAMGPSRSLDRLRDWAGEQAGIRPCMRTIEKWSEKGGWQARIKEMDEKILAKTEAALVTTTAGARTRQIARAMSLAEKCAMKADTVLEKKYTDKQLEKDDLGRLTTAAKTWRSEVDELQKGLSEESAKQEAMSDEERVTFAKQRANDIREALLSRSQGILARRTTVTEEIIINGTDGEGFTQG